MRSLILLIFFLFVHCASAQELDDAARTQSLQSALRSLVQLKGELVKKQEFLESSSSKGREDEITAQIKELSREIAKLRRNFIEIASETDPSILKPTKVGDEIVWSHEVHELLSPLLDEIKRVSSKPRENAALRKSITENEEKLAAVEQAIKNIDDLLGEELPESLRFELEDIKNWWEEGETSLKASLQIAQTKLRKNLRGKQSFTESLSGITDIFFKSRGRNLLIALLAAFLFWAILRKIYLYFERHPKLADRDRRQYERAFAVVYLFLTGVGTLLVFLAALFFFEDWVLLTLAALVAIGIAWTSKEALPRYWTQAMLLLNLGATREGERVIYNGLPYKVDTLNFYTTFVNPLLSGGMLRLPIKDLEELRSRSIGADEQWFPTMQGDWILFDDGKIAQVTHQSIEYVFVKYLGGEERSFVTTDFLSLTPTVLSKGFRIESTFGIDYGFQDKITDEIPRSLREFIYADLERRDFTKYLEGLQVEFELADSSSLNVLIIADFRGEAAEFYELLSRLMQRLAVDCATKNGWTIPFPQLTLHNS